MARLHEVSEPESDGEFPDLATLLEDVRIDGDARKSNGKKSAKERKGSWSPGATVQEVLGTRDKKSHQRRLSDRAPSQVTCAIPLLPAVRLPPSGLAETRKTPRKTTRKNYRPVQESGKQLRASGRTNYRNFEESEDLDNSDTSLSGFIVSDSASENEKTSQKSAPRSPEKFNRERLVLPNSDGGSTDEDFPMFAPPKTPRRLISRRERDLLESAKTARKVKEPQEVIDLISPIKQTIVEPPLGRTAHDDMGKDGISRSRSQSVETDDVSQQESRLTRDSSATDSSLLERSLTPTS